MWYSGYRSYYGPRLSSLIHCENRGGDIGSGPPTPRKRVARQSTDATLLLQNKIKRELGADGLLSDQHNTELLAAVDVRATIPLDLDMSMPLQGDVQTPILASIPVRDKVPSELDADGLLAEDHHFEFEASMGNLVAMPRAPVDADMCIVTPVPRPITASMLLLPDTASEMLTELERTHIQKFRIIADPRSYREFDSRDPDKMGGVIP